jgi:hypothetical protein
LAAAEAHLDSVVLSDGSRLMGLVTEDADDHVTVREHGVDRRLSRSRVLRVDYNDPDAPLYTIPAESARPAAPVDAATAAPTSLQPSTDPALTDYCNGVADYYQVPVWQVVSVQQRLPIEEVPVVFHLAAAAHVSPNLVLSLHLGGLSWGQVGLRFGLGNDLFYVEGGPGLVGTHYGRLYHEFWSLPRARWVGLRLSDADIVDCVNLRFVTRYYHRPVVEVAKIRVQEPFYRHAWRPAPRVVRQPVVIRRTVIEKGPAPERHERVREREQRDNGRRDWGRSGEHRQDGRGDRAQERERRDRR